MIFAEAKARERLQEPKAKCKSFSGQLMHRIMNLDLSQRLSSQLYRDKTAGVARDLTKFDKF